MCLTLCLLDPKTNEPTRVGYNIRLKNDGEKVRTTKKVRVAKKSGEILDDSNKDK